MAKQIKLYNFYGQKKIRAKTKYTQNCILSKRILFKLENILLYFKNIKNIFDEQ